jgi:hypothetical protein
MYEETLHSPENIKLGVAEFISRKSLNANEAVLLELIEMKKMEINLNLVHLFHLTHLIRILPYQYKNGLSHVKYWQDVVIYQFESRFK